MKDIKTQVVVADGREGDKPVLVPEEPAPDAGHLAAKETLFREVKEMVSLIRLDRNEVLEQIVSGQRGLANAGAREILADPYALLGTALFEQWKEEQIELPHVHLYEGVCGHESHSWFRAEMEAEECGEPNYYYIIDPFARGVSVIHLGPSAAESDLAVVKPWSPFNKLYFGRRRGTLIVERGNG